MLFERKANLIRNQPEFVRKVGQHVDRYAVESVVAKVDVAKQRVIREFGDCLRFQLQVRVAT